MHTIQKVTIKLSKLLLIDYTNRKQFTNAFVWHSFRIGCIDYNLFSVPWITTFKCLLRRWKSTLPACYFKSSSLESSIHCSTGKHFSKTKSGFYWDTFKLAKMLNTDCYNFFKTIGRL